MIELIFRAQDDAKARKIQKDLLESNYQLWRGDAKSKALKKLLTNGMDDECVWQQLELWNSEKFDESLKTVSRFLAVDSGSFQLALEDLESDADGEGEENSGSEKEGSDESGNDQDSDNGSELAGSAEEDENESDSNEEEEEKAAPVKKKKGKEIVTEDRFFKLSEMEEFLNDQDRRDMNKKRPDEEEDIDYFADDNDDVNLSESLRYSDYFNKDSGNEDDEEESEPEEKPDEPKSTFELKQERLKNKIARMEESMLENKSWQMKGEVRAETRPQNSLLEEVLEFESTTRPAPIITEKVTFKLEDIIKQRIKDKAFDDVERKVKPSDIQFEYKKQLVLDQEKSKQSLAQVYEKEYLKELEKNNPNAGDVEEEEPKEHKIIRAELKDLFEKLDLLSNFHYTPRPAQPELKIITNLPTIAMEEVAPTTVGNATLLAPEEVKAKPIGGNIIGASERTKTDKNRERRHKKDFQRKKFMKDKNSSKETIINKVVKSRNVTKVIILILSWVTV